MSARDDVLAAVRAALAATRQESSAGPSAWHRAATATVRDDGASSSVVAVGGGDDATSAASVVDREAVLDLFAERVADYRADVSRCADADLAAVVETALGSAGSVVVPAGLDLHLPNATVDDGLTWAELDAIEAVVTAAAVGIAETGTVILDHGPAQGRRAITLLPDLHVCIVRESQVVPDIGDALALLDPRRPQTWVSGPSATSDIELSRVEGVHGPRRLHVVLVG